jgi:hypothetical protein
MQIEGISAEGVRISDRYIQGISVYYIGKKCQFLFQASDDEEIKLRASFFSGICQHKNTKAIKSYCIKAYKQK